MLERFGVDPPHCMAGHHADSLYDGVPISDWDGTLVVRCTEPGSLEDFPWANEHVVSERLRLLLEKCAPACAQYLPMALQNYDGSPVADRYWLVNWLYTVDFCDREHSDYASCSEHTSYFEIVVDGAKIPGHMPVCRMMGLPTFVVIRDDIKNVIEEHGFTGCQFYTVRMLEDVLRQTSKSKHKQNKHHE
ncbi:MAG: hypothetical protein KF902_06715 [Phycisphaeraceae bacterium]|nr:hypothetical protein [Phycisphaeraceae bacterium]